MTEMNFFSTFRGRLLLIFACLIVVTLSVQYYVNLLVQRENDAERDLQSQALVSAFAIGFGSLTSKNRVSDLINDPNQKLLDQQIKERIRDIIIINNNWQIDDSLNPEYLPALEDDGQIIYQDLSSLKGLPPLIEGFRLGEDLKNFPNASYDPGSLGDDEAHAIPVETSKGRWYVMVILKNDRSEAAWRAARPLIATLIILLFSTLLTIFLVWRFTKPIAELSAAARSLAGGNLSVRVPDYGRNDEIGTLTRNFNEMAAELEKASELEAKLRQAEQSAVVGRLGSAIAHEIRNPLNYINLSLDHLSKRYSPTESDKREAFLKLTSQIKSEVERINRQITDFLNYSRPVNPKLQNIEIRPVINESLRLVEADSAEKGIKISVIEEGEIPNVLADPQFLRSVFNNLFINAIQAMEPMGGKLTVKIRPAENNQNVEIEISDTGSGIEAKNLDKIFEPYFSTKETGTGLGLAIVKRIIEVHSGTIKVNSKPAAGTTFLLKLPTADATNV
jgi:signal transduction histidine kinase